MDWRGKVTASSCSGLRAESKEDMREHEGNGNAIVGNWWFLPFLLKGMRRTGWLRHPHQFKVQLMHGEAGNVYSAWLCASARFDQIQNQRSQYQLDRQSHFSSWHDNAIRP